MTRLPQSIQQVSLKDIHGTEIPYVRVQIERDLVVDDQSPTVLVVGSAIELGERTVPVASTIEIDRFCVEIARSLAKYGFNLVTDACPGIPNHVERAYVAQSSRGVSLDLSILREADERDTHRAYSPTGFPACGDILVFCGTGFEMLSILNTHCVDLVLVVGGGLGSLMEGAIAVVNDLPVACFSPSGGMSGEMQTLFERYRSRYKNLRITTYDSLKDLDDFLADYALRFREQGRNSRLEGFISSLHLTDAAPRSLQIDININRDLNHITYEYDHNTIRIPDPVLVIDDARILQHTTMGAAVRSHLDSAPRCYRFEEVAITVPSGIPALAWCPSIDTFMLIALMRPHLRQSYGKVLDVGTGTGVIAIWMAGSGHASEVVGIDLNAEATRCAAVNTAAAGLADKCRIITSRYEVYRRDDSCFDLITCTPPYVPMAQSESREDGSFDGVNLVIELLSSLDRVLTLGGECFMTLSSASWTNSTVASLMQGHIDSGCAVMMGERTLPFKLVDVLLDRQWLSELVDGGGVFRTEDDHYAYWHKVQVWRLMPIVSERGIREI